MDFGALAKGFFAGAAIAAPLGPVGILCIHRGFSSGRAAAFLSGLGAATAHGTYALAAALGHSLASGALARHASSFRAAAGIFLCLFGARILFSRPADPANQGKERALAGAYDSTLLLAISSPVTMLTIAAVFSGAGLPGPGGGTFAALVLVAGPFDGRGVAFPARGDPRPSPREPGDRRGPPGVRPLHPPETPRRFLKKNRHGMFRSPETCRAEGTPRNGIR